jgi:porphobilinogen synthase
MSDLCLDEFTSHGHCGVLAPDGACRQRRDAAALRRDGGGPGRAGRPRGGPSGMMDGQVGACARRSTRPDTPTSRSWPTRRSTPPRFYGPFREAVESSLSRRPRTYQQDPPNLREALREVALDVGRGRRHRDGQAGAALPRRGRGGRGGRGRAGRGRTRSPASTRWSRRPRANGWIDRERAILETLTSIRRAGADIILTTGPPRWEHCSPGLAGRRAGRCPVCESDTSCPARNTPLRS